MLSPEIWVPAAVIVAIVACLAQCLYGQIAWVRRVNKALLAIVVLSFSIAESIGSVDQLMSGVSTDRSRAGGQQVTSLGQFPLFFTFLMTMKLVGCAGLTLASMWGLYDALKRAPKPSSM